MATKTKQHHRRRMDGWRMSGGEKIASVHQSGDGQPAIYSSGTRNVRARLAGFKVADKEIELRAKNNIEKDEDRLHDQTHPLRAVRLGAAKLFLLCRTGLSRNRRID